MLVKPVVGVIQARMGSARLPGKVLMTLAGKSVLWHVVNRVRRAVSIDEVLVATSNLPGDDKIEALCRAEGFSLYRGDERDVLRRYWDAARFAQASTVVRITADCPLIDPEVIDRLLALYSTGEFDYASNVWPQRTFAHGHDVEVFSLAALAVVQAEATEPEEREHVTPYFRKEPLKFRIGSLESDEDNSGLRITLDTYEDYALISKVYDAKYREGEIITLSEVREVLRS